MIVPYKSFKIVLSNKIGEITAKITNIPVAKGSDTVEVIKDAQRFIETNLVPRHKEERQDAE